MPEATQHLVEPLVNLVSSWGLQVIGAIAVFIVGRIACGALRRGTRRALERSSVDATLIPYISSGVYYLALTVVVLAVLNLFGIQTASVIAVLGAAGLAVGLAMQGTLSSFAAGVMLLVFRPFKVGDYVEAGGNTGSVQEIGIFSTILHTSDNVKITVPNSRIYGNTIKNYSANDTRRNDLVIGISYGDDIARAMETIRKVLAADSRVLEDPAPVVVVAELADSSVNLAARPWCRSADYGALRSDLTRKLKEELEAAGCSIPFPQRDVHVHQTGGASA